MRTAERTIFAAIAFWLVAGAALAEPQPLCDVRILSADEMEGRAAGSPGAARARAYLVERLRRLGVQPAYPGFEQPFSYQHEGRTHSGVNLVGRIPGRDPSGRVMVVSAHYDHLGVREGRIYNGADDNASGVAGLLAVAESFKRRPPRHTVMLALMDAEEQGLSGARAFVADPPTPLARVALAVNLDMLSQNDKGELYVAGARRHPWLGPPLEALAERAPVTLKQGHEGPAWTGADDWSEGSDHYAFGAAGVPWVYFGVEDHPRYHRPTDDFATIPQNFFLRSVETVVSAARLFDRELDALGAAAGR